MYTDTVYLLHSPLAALYGTHPTKQFFAQVFWGDSFGQTKEVVGRGGGYLVSNKGGVGECYFDCRVIVAILGVIID